MIYGNRTFIRKRDGKAILIMVVDEELVEKLPNECQVLTTATIEGNSVNLTMTDQVVPMDLDPMGYDIGHLVMAPIWSNFKSDEGIASLYK